MLKGLLSDGTDNNLSSKRVVTVLSFLFCSIAFIANLFWSYKVEQYMFEGMIYLTMAGLGFTASEKFVSKKFVYKNNRSENEQ
jgi:hypothetical protein